VIRLALLEQKVCRGEKKIAGSGCCRVSCRE
jgi:hypothetical protein